MCRINCTAIVVLSFAATNAIAADSSYSSIADNACHRLRVVKIDDTVYATSRVCRGVAGFKIYIDEEDLRETLTVGKTPRQAAREPAATARFSAFNGYEEKIEWRLGRSREPYALIAGWYFSDNENLDATGRPKDERFLVVMRLPPGPVCKVAYVDRDANDDATALARKAADQGARKFNCGSDTPVMIGKTGPAAAAFARLQEDRTPKP